MITTRNAHPFLTASLGLAGCAAAVGAYALVEARLPRVRTTRITLERLRQPLTVIQIADAHMHHGSQWLERFLVNQAQRYRGALVLNTGDNFSTQAGFERLKRVFSSSAWGSNPGVFVFGSNDYYSAVPKNPIFYPLLRYAHFFGYEQLIRYCEPKKRTEKDLPHAEFAAYLRRMGWRDARNTAHDFTVASDSGAPLRVSLIGVDDPHISRDRLPAPTDRWQSADLRIGLTHAPYSRVLDMMTALGADIIIAGHTHGGQVCIPTFGPLVNNCDIPLKFTRGLHQWNCGEVETPQPRETTGATDIISPHHDGLPFLAKRLVQGNAQTSTQLYVSQGLGCAVYTPIRLACRPTLDVLELVPSNDTKV
ncbi:MAG: hypothetical protein Q4P66_01205 [Actinomycetaceae bacterium]|nr:hypothetical protein [Actinomycetaceae bacterium]